MKVTVCELPHEPAALAAAWSALCEHAVRQASELVLLPEFAMVDPVWQDERFDAARWAAAAALSEVWRHRLPELGVAHVVGTRPVTIDGRRFTSAWGPNKKMAEQKAALLALEELGVLEPKEVDEALETIVTDEPE